jgi:hypothetical protein
MQKVFHNILMPVRLNGNAIPRINSAIQFANHLGCHLHLLFVANSPFFKFNHKKIETQAKARMLELKDACHEKLKPGLKLFTAFKWGSSWNNTAQYAESNGIDLVLATDRFKGDLARSESETGFVHCPVLRMPFNGSQENFKTIILPIESAFPINKIRIAVYLARQFEATIHLVSRKKDELLNTERYNIERTYRALKNNTDLRVVCHAIDGKKLSAEVVHYANAVNAGLVVLNPLTDSTFGNFIRRLFPGFISKKSVPVLTVF